jgi:hypothetical protein
MLRRIDVFIALTFMSGFKCCRIVWALAPIIILAKADVLHFICPRPVPKGMPLAKVVAIIKTLFCVTSVSSILILSELFHGFCF